MVLPALLFSFYFCACEEALASIEAEGHERGSCVGHDADHSHHQDGDTDHKDNSPCCAKIYAVQASTKFFNAFPNQARAFGNFKIISHDTLIADYRALARFQIFKFPSGVSPPGNFPASHFTHAPPAGL